jgi:hypothetical protein
MDSRWQDEELTAAEAAVVIGEVGVRRFERESIAFNIYEVAMDTGWEPEEIQERVEAFRADAAKGSEPLLAASRRTGPQAGRQDIAIVFFILIVVVASLCPFLIWMFPAPG